MGPLKNILAVFIVSLTFQCAAQTKSFLKENRTYNMPGVEGRIDHMTIDTKTNRLFVAALGNGSVEVIDLHEGKVIHSIKNLKEPQGVVYVEKNNLLFVASGGDGTCKIFNGLNYKLEKIIDLGDDADNVRYDKNKNLVYIGYGSGGIAVLNPTDMKLLYKIELPAHPESFQIYRREGKIYVNVPTDNQLDVVSTEERKIINKINLKVRSNFPMALDTADQLIFIGSRNPAQLVLFDAASLKIISQKNISGDADDIYYDFKKSLIFVSCGRGFMDIFEKTNTGDFIFKESVKTVPGARTSLYMPGLNKFFVAARKYDGRNARIIEYSVN